MPQHRGLWKFLSTCYHSYQRHRGEHPTSLCGALASWAGVPAELVLDPSQPNLSQDLCQPCENEGSRVRHTAADAHWQLGKVERHGGLFQTVFKKVLTEVEPTDAESWKECVVQATWAKNSMINVAGISPCQFVFGRNPRIRTDLLQNSPDPIASDAVLTEPAVQPQQRIRLAARYALVEEKDSAALRQALRRLTKPKVPSGVPCFTSLQGCQGAHR